MKPEARATTNDFGRLSTAVLFVMFATLPFNGMIALKRIALLVFVAIALMSLWRQRRWPRIPWAVTGWFVLAPLSLLWSADLRYTASQLLPDVAFPFLGMLAACVLADHPRAGKAAIAGLLAGAIAVIATGLLQASQQPDYDWHPLAHGFGQFSTYLVLLLPFVLLAALEKVRTRKWLLALLCLLLLGAIFMAGYTTNNRMFWLSALFVIDLLVVLVMMRKEYVALRRPVAAGVFIATVGIVAAFILVARNHPANVVGVPGETSLASTFTDSERFEMWRFWFERIQEHPWFGIGFGYDLPMLTYRSIKPAHWFDLMFAHAHNTFINVTVQLGVVGLFSFCLALVTLALIFWRAARDVFLPHALVGIAGLGVLLGMVSKNLTDDFFWRGPLFAFWLLIGLLLGVLQRERKV